MASQTQETETERFIWEVVSGCCDSAKARHPNHLGR